MLKNLETIMAFSQMEHIKEEQLMQAEMNCLKEQNRIKEGYLKNLISSKMILCENDEEK